MKPTAHEDAKTYSNSSSDWLIEPGDHRTTTTGFVIGLKMVFRRVPIGTSDFRAITNECQLALLGLKLTTQGSH